MLRLPWAAHAAFFNLRQIFKPKPRRQIFHERSEKKKVKQTLESSLQGERLGLRTSGKV
jgi:hypothetical protein